MKKIVVWRARRDPKSTKLVFWILESRRRRWIDKNRVLEAPGCAGSSKILSWRAPEGAGSRKIEVWRASGDVGWTKVVVWKLQKALDHQKYCPGGLQKARVEKTSVLEVSRRRWIDKNSVLAAARRLSIWRQVRTTRTATGGGKRPKQLFSKILSN